MIYLPIVLRPAFVYMKSEWVNGWLALETNQFETSSLSDLLQYRGQSIVSSDETTYTGY